MSLVLYLAIGTLAAARIFGLSTDVRAAARRLFPPRLRLRTRFRLVNRNENPLQRDHRASLRLQAFVMLRQEFDKLVTLERGYQCSWGAPSASYSASLVNPLVETKSPLSGARSVAMKFGRSPTLTR